MNQKLATEIRKALRERKDIWLDESVGPSGAPEIRGVQLRRFQEHEVRGAESYHPYQHRGWKYVGQAFAIETSLKKAEQPLTREQAKWRDAFENVGGVYITARSMADVTDELGAKEPQPWSEFTDRVTKIGNVLNAQ